MWCIYTMEYYLMFKKGTILSFVTTGINVKDIMLHEISKALKDKYCVTSHLHVEYKTVKLIEPESKMVGTRGEGLGGLRSCC